MISACACDAHCSDGAARQEVPAELALTADVNSPDVPYCETAPNSQVAMHDAKATDALPSRHCAQAHDVPNLQVATLGAQAHSATALAEYAPNSAKVPDATRSDAQCRASTPLLAVALSNSLAHTWHASDCSRGSAHAQASFPGSSDHSPRDGHARSVRVQRCSSHFRTRSDGRRDKARSTPLRRSRRLRRSRIRQPLPVALRAKNSPKTVPKPLFSF